MRWRSRHRSRRDPYNRAVLNLNVDLGERSYPILIGESLLSDASLLQQHLTARDILLVTNTTVGPLYAVRVMQALQGGDAEPEL